MYADELKMIDEINVVHPHLNIFVTISDVKVCFVIFFFSPHPRHLNLTNEQFAIMLLNPNKLVFMLDIVTLCRIRCWTSRMPHLIYWVVGGK